MIRTIGGLCGTVVLITGCYIPIEVRHDPYPADWPALAAPSAGCPDFSGLYSNEPWPSGRMEQVRSGRVLLASWVLTDTHTPPEVISVVEFDGPHDKVVTLRLFQGSGASLTERGRHLWKEGEHYQCDSGWLVLSSTKALFPLGVAVENTAGRFALAQDGWLVVERRVEGGGVIVVFPTYYSARDWIRYPRVEGSSLPTAPSDPQ